MGNQGFRGEARAKAQSSLVLERSKAATRYLLSQHNQHKRATPRACSIGKPTEGYRCHTQRNLTLAHVAG